MDPNHRLLYWQRFTSSICCGVGKAAWDAQLAAWSGSAGQSPLPKASCLGIVCLFVVCMMAMRALRQLTEAHINPTMEENTGEAQNISDLEVN